MMAKVDLPVPRIPTNTMEASGAKCRSGRPKGVVDTGGGVSRGVELELGLTEAALVSTRAQKHRHSSSQCLVSFVLRLRSEMGASGALARSPGKFIASSLMVLKDLFVRTAGAVIIDFEKIQAH